MTYGELIGLITIGPMGLLCLVVGIIVALSDSDYGS